MPPVHFTERQSQWVHRFLTLFTQRAGERQCLPGMYLLQLAILREAIEDNVSFGQEDFDLIAWAVEWYLRQFDDEDIDPLAEQVYAHLKGHWYFDEPWYDRMRDNLHLVGLELTRQLPRLGT
jgi:hypothetical protein